MRPMRIECVGGGPAGLYFAILMRKAFPTSRVTVRERNRAEDTFGWGVVFSEETLESFRAADPETDEEIRRSFVRWGDIETWYGDACVRSTGHGFCGLARKRLLQILHERCRGLGVELLFQSEVADPETLAAADLVVGSDGANSTLRARYAEHFRPRVEQGRCRFSWLGTTKPLSAFTFIFRESEHGLFQVHAYPFQAGPEPLGTFIVECSEPVWRRAGLDSASEAETVAYFERLFADHLDGHRLLSNRSIWRSFPTVTCERWSHGKVVLMGDAAHTAHFSIGSGTKLAMEDAIALAAAFRAQESGEVARVLATYEEARRVEVAKLQRAAKTSREWFEDCGRYVRQHPLQFTFNLMTRSRRITWDNLWVRDRSLVERVAEWFADQAGARRIPGRPAPPPIFTPLRLRGLELENRIVVSPMCQYSASAGVPGEWHLVHLGSRAVGGAALVFTEMTDVTADGRITHACTGMYTDEQERAWKRIVDFVHSRTRARIGMQLAHAGRKGSCNLPWEGDDPLRDGRAWTTIAPSAAPFDAGWPAPRAMDREDMERVRAAFAAAARRADRAGFDALELHMAHGYLLSSFLSPKANLRTDEHGGSLENRMRFPLEVFAAVRAAWPERKPISVRLSATDWLDDQGGLTLDQSVEIARALKALGCDLIDVSSAGNVPESKPEYGRMYQVGFAERIRHEAGIAVMAVGAIQSADHANTVIAAGRADLCALARAHLLDPYLTMRAAVRYGIELDSWPNQYLPAKPKLS